MLLSAQLLPVLGVSDNRAGTFRILLAAVYFHFLLLSLMTFLLYIEAFRQAFVSALVFFGLNLLGSLATVCFHHAAWDGLSYLISAATASIVAFIYLDFGTRRLDRLVLARYSSG